MIIYDIGSSSLGCLILAKSVDGVCAVALADNQDELIDWLLLQYPDATRTPDDPALQGMLLQLLNYVEKPTSSLNFKLDMHGTDFQKQVWEKLTEIPNGETISYSELAAQVGKPTAHRAVATACAKNKIAVLIPCHRVIGKNGKLAGYRWGIDLKLALLDLENSTNNTAILE